MEPDVGLAAPIHGRPRASLQVNASPDSGRFSGGCILRLVDSVEEAFSQFCELPTTSKLMNQLGGSFIRCLAGYSSSDEGET